MISSYTNLKLFKGDSIKVDIKVIWGATLGSTSVPANLQIISAEGEPIFASKDIQEIINQESQKNT